MSIQRKSTEKVELVETHNLALSFQRLRALPGQYNEDPARRALYHALCMSYLFDTDSRRLIREALKLP
jgi:hypothetical protein